MSKPTRAPGGSSLHTPNAREEEREEVDNDEESAEDESVEGKQKPVNPREAILARMDERLTQLREAEVAGISSVETIEDDEESDDEEGQDPPVEEEESSDTEADPLAQFVVVKGGKPMFRTKVDGVERLIPLTTAQAQLQKHEAAETRLQQASERNKALDNREARLRQEEAALVQKKKTPPPETDEDDPDLEEEARTLAKVLLTEPEDKVAESLAKTLKKLRQAPKAPSVDANEIVSTAVKVVRKQMVDESFAEDQVEGIKAFERDFADINGDPNLYRYADALSDTIAQEHPTWKPSQVMAEAGKKTREWVASLKGGKPAPGLKSNDRLKMKQGLTPMPKSRSVKRQAPVQKREDNSPQAAMNEIRKSRGQAF